MKERKQLLRTVLFVITFTVILIYLINHTSVIAYFFRTIINMIFPFLLGCGIAFVINIPMRGIENSLFKNKNGKLYKVKRPISMIISYILALLVVVLVIFEVVPEVGETLDKIGEKLPAFVEEAKVQITKYTTKYPEITESIMSIELDWNEIGDLFKDKGSTILSTTVSIFSSIVSTIVNIFVGIVFSMYILLQKEELGRKVKLVFYAMFKESTADELMVFGKIANTTFSKFFTCQFREGIIIGTMFGISMYLIGLPYPLTIGILIAFTALIPIFGAFVGLFIGAFLILVESPSSVLWFIVLFFVIQFIENYFIYPKLVGGDIGLSAIWVLLAVIVGGDLFGVVGMFVFIPLVSVFYAYLRSIIYRKLKYKNIDVDKKQVPDDVMPLMSTRRRLFQPRPKQETAVADGAKKDVEDTEKSQEETQKQEKESPKKDKKK